MENYDISLDIYDKFESMILEYNNDKLFEASYKFDSLHYYLTSYLYITLQDPTTILENE
jgi:hypothetical protein